MTAITSAVNPWHGMAHQVEAERQVEQDEVDPPAAILASPAAGVLDPRR